MRGNVSVPGIGSLSLNSTVDDNCAVFCHASLAGCKEGHRTLKKITKKDKRGDDAFDQGDYQTAIDRWWEAMNTDLSLLAFVRPTLLKVVRAHMALKDYAKAIEEAEKHVQNEESIEGLHALGEAQLGAEKFDEALRTYQKAFEIAVSVLFARLWCVCAGSLIVPDFFAVPLSPDLACSPRTGKENATRRSRRRRRR